jgi:hypothetical protein
VITFLSPGLRFFHQGQFTGRKKRISPHLVRAPLEPIITTLLEFYGSLLRLLKRPIFRNGKWSLLECRSAWEGNNSSDSFLSFSWKKNNSNRVIVCVNYSPDTGQCYIRLPFSELANKQWRLHDLMSEVSYDRDGNDLLRNGLYLDTPGWKFHVFEMKNF